MKRHESGRDPRELVGTFSEAIRQRLDPEQYGDHAIIPLPDIQGRGHMINDLYDTVACQAPILILQDTDPETTEPDLKHSRDALAGQAESILQQRVSWMRHFGTTKSPDTNEILYTLGTLLSLNGETLYIGSGFSRDGTYYALICKNPALREDNVTIGLPPQDQREQIAFMRIPPSDLPQEISRPVSGLLAYGDALHHRGTERVELIAPVTES